MSISAFKSAFNKEKPISSITNLIEIATSPTQPDESYDNFPELVQSIILQGTGPAEASRALRKKVKHGNSHQQYRALFILKALMENTPGLKRRYLDDQLIDALKHLASDPTTETKVRRILNVIAASLNAEFKSDFYITELYKECRAANRRPNGPSSNSVDVDRMLQAAGLHTDTAEQKRKEKEERDAAKRKAKQEKADMKRKQEEARRNRGRRPFNFEAEKPQIVTSIANASQASNNLINAMKLVNPDNERVATNEHVKECFERAKVARKTIVRYIQLVENEEMIGTLIATNEQVIAAMQMHDDLVAAATVPPADPTAEIQSGMAAVTLSPGESRSAEEGEHTGEYAHPDLQDLSFGPLGHEQGALPPPIKPSTHRASLSDDDWDHVGGGTLSDLSDFEEDEPHNNPGPSSSTHKERIPVHAEDPFADPFAD